MLGRGLGVAVALVLVAAPTAQGQTPDETLAESEREQSCRALAASTVGLPDPVRSDPGGGLPAGWALAPPGLVPARVDLRTQTESFNRLYEFALRAGQLYARRAGVDPWRQVPLPACIGGRLTAISVDDDELVALDRGARVFTMDNALKDATLWNWSSRWGPPTWTGPGYALPGGVLAWSWSVISQVEDGSWRDPAGNRTAVGAGKVSHIWGLRTGGQRLTFWDPWLPLDESYEMCGPRRGRFKAVNLSASGSHVFVIGANGDMYTRLYDFDISGHDPVFFRYAYEDQRGKGDGAPIQLPAEPWARQPKIPGEITSAISIHKVGTGSVHRILRVEGRRSGATGYWERDIASQATGWTFTPTGRPLAGRKLANPASDTSAKGLGASEDHRYVMDRDGIRAELLDFNVYCSPARLRVTQDGRTRDLLLHNVDGLRQQVRGRGLDDTPRTQNGAIEGPTGTFEKATIRATQSDVVLEERGWRFRLADPPSSGRTCLARRVRVRRDRVGRVELGMKRRNVDRRLPTPVKRTKRIRRWCVKGGGSVIAVLARGRVAAVVTTARGHRARRSRTIVIGKRRGRVRYVAVVPRRTKARPRVLRMRLRQAGVLRRGH